MAYYLSIDSRYRIDPARASRLSYAMIVFTVSVPFVSGMLLLPEHLLSGLVFAGLLYSLACGGKIFLVNPITSYIGTLSYSAYFIHFAILMVLGDRLQLIGLVGIRTASIVEWLTGFGMVMGLTILLATLCRDWIEKPFVRLGTKLARRVALPAA
jgi:peptidoglycan/LPS O-acetylase OafA/YrhL